MTKCYKTPDEHLHDEHEQIRANARYNAMLTVLAPIIKDHNKAIMLAQIAHKVVTGDVVLDEGARAISDKYFNE